jgi:hypothetical protein
MPCSRLAGSATLESMKITAGPVELVEATGAVED